MPKKVWLSFVAAAAVLLLGTAAWGQDFYVVAGGGSPVGTKITSLPAGGLKINDSGFYFLGRNLSYSSTSGNAISIDADNVTLDLMGFSLTGPGVSNTANGILINNHANAVVRNGTVLGFKWGILATGDVTSCNSNKVSGIRAFGNKYLGIELDNANNLAINCTCSNNGGGIFVQSGIISGCVADNNNLSAGWGSGIGMWGTGSVIGNVATNNHTHNFYLGNGYVTPIVADRNGASSLATNYYSDPGTSGVQMGINSGTP